MDFNIFPYESSQPLDEKLIIFMSFPDFSVGSLVFWEYIIKNTDFKTVWFVEDTEVQKKMQQDGIICYNFSDEDKNNYISKAKYVVLDKICPEPMPKLKGQIWVLLYSAVHFSHDVFGSIFFINNKDFLISVKRRSSIVDLTAVNSKMARVYTSAIQYIDSRKLYVTGSPKFDPIFNDDGNAILFKFLPELKEFNKLILYCPTACRGHGFDFGNDFSENIFKIKDFNLTDFESFLEKYNISIVFKMHPVDEKYFKETTFKLPKNCFLINSNSFYRNSIYNILNAFDILITDTSQLANEYLLLDRPIIYNNINFKEMDNVISYYIQDDDIIRPGVKYNNYSEFKNAIIESLENPKKYSNKRERVKKILHEYNDGNSCERVFELMQKYNPIESIEYKLFTEPYKIQYEQTKKELDNILSSRSYKFIKRIKKIINLFIKGKK